MTREWSLVCLARDFPATLAAWELPGQDGIPDGQRVFESIWSLDESAAREAARACAQVVSDLGHDVSPVMAQVNDPSPRGPGDLRHATALFNRVLSYVDGLR
jgi:DICT domain-containing protein